jgi:hypothetical protein
MNAEAPHYVRLVLQHHYADTIRDLPDDQLASLPVFVIPLVFQLLQKGNNLILGFLESPMAGSEKPAAVLRVSKWAIAIRRRDAERHALNAAAQRHHRRALNPF